MSARLLTPFPYVFILGVLMINVTSVPLDAGVPHGHIPVLATDRENTANAQAVPSDARGNEFNVPKIAASVDADEAASDTGSSRQLAAEEKDPAANEPAFPTSQTFGLDRGTLSSDGSEHPSRMPTRKEGAELIRSPVQGRTARMESDTKHRAGINMPKAHGKGGGGDSDGPSVPPCDTDAENELRRLGVPGLSAVIVKNGRVACTAVAGMANIEKKRPVEPETVFAWASVSKTVTAVAVMQLVDAGALALDDDINDYLPFPVTIPACPEKPITVLHLLTHTSSIVDYRKVYSSLYVKGDSPLALGDFLKDYLVPGGAYYDNKKNFKNRCPGTATSYSNVGVGLLGYLVEVVAGTSFETFCRDHIFTPLGMNEAAWRLADLDPDRVAIPYSGDFSSGFKPLGHQGFPTFPDGLLRTSAPQLARFLLMFMQFGKLDGTRILSQESAANMRHINFPKLNSKQGLIWVYDSFAPRKRVIGHEGLDPGTSSMMFFDFKDGAGVLLVANGSWKWDRAVTFVERLFREAGRIDDKDL